MADGTAGTAVDSTACTCLVSGTTAGVGSTAGWAGVSTDFTALSAGCGSTLDSTLVLISGTAGVGSGNDLPVTGCSGTLLTAADSSATGAGGASRFFSSDFSGIDSSFFDGKACGSGIFSLSNDFCAAGASVAATVGATASGTAATAGTAGTVSGADFTADVASRMAGATVDETAS